ncbi:hypothetical protein J8281_16260 [Aquimarina sp. U1-2]|uniref:hypothetical protein n=1 Tax=Aquimarina sp. U1-2 TaxID=2823141 RepID=UPI001AECC74D|nr:hypothetical protein [Aquimarina sp. U1-2]MBP2833750.1 hypothetical protein [Aquimarina sp. U1-2]
MIASITAFIVAGLNFDNLFAWMFPSIIGTVYIIFWSRKVENSKAVGYCSKMPFIFWLIMIHLPFAIFLNQFRDIRFAIVRCAVFIHVASPSTFSFKMPKVP